MQDAVIVSATRTACGKAPNGSLRTVRPDEMGAAVIQEALRRAPGIKPAEIDDVIMGCVGQAGEQSANIGRNAVLASRLPESVPGTSIDRQCGSSQQAVQFAAQAVMSGTMDVVIAAGVESMTRVPMGMPSSLPAKNGMGHYMSPAIRTKYPGPDFSQFMGAEMMVKKYGLTKADLDAYALSSHERAIAATKSGAFKDEIIPIAVKTAETVARFGKRSVLRIVLLSASVRTNLSTVCNEGRGQYATLWKKSHFALTHC
jgi:acetyl-CoA C-acetyltransferase